MKRKVAELTGPALDWAVAKCEGKSGDCEFHAGNLLYGRATSGFFQYRPSTDWAQGGPIIENEGIELRYEGQWVSSFCLENGDVAKYRAHTPLIAAMRCYVASKMGEEIELPEELA